MNAEQHDVYLIAEAGVNHNGDLGRAHAMIEAAASAGADAIKFQTFVPNALASAAAKKAEYQQRNEPRAESQLVMLSRLALDFDSHFALKAHCHELDIEFLSSPFDLTSARFLVDKLQLPTIKLGSGELTNAPLLWQLARSPAQLILSTGMATLDEVRQSLGLMCLALDAVQPTSLAQCGEAFDPDRLLHRVTLLHCTTDYPCPIDQVNLRAMDTLREATGLRVGYSDHTNGIAVSLAAAARGARVIEKHFTLDRELPGPDHRASLLPDELADLVSGVHCVVQSLGDGEKRPRPVELANLEVARKSLVAAAPIRRGEIFDERNVTSKRPGNGLSPMQYWWLLGQVAERDYAVDELIEAPPQ